MIGFKSKHSICFRTIALILVCLFLVNDLSWAAPSYNSSFQTTLAPELRLKPFFEKHGLDFKNIFSVYLVAAELRNLATAKEVRDSRIVKLNRIFQNGEIEIEKDVGKDKFIETYYLECTGRKCRYAILNFKKDNAKIKILFPENPSTLDEKELIELGIKTEKDREYFSRGGLEGVWFKNLTATVNTETTESAVIPKKSSVEKDFPRDANNDLVLEPLSKPENLLPHTSKNTPRDETNGSGGVYASMFGLGHLVELTERLAKGTFGLYKEIWEDFKQRFEDDLDRVQSAVDSILMFMACLIKVVAIPVAYFFDSYAYSNISQVPQLLLSQPIGLWFLEAYLLFYTLYKRRGLIQLILLMTGLGLGYGFGSRYTRGGNPRRDSDYDIGLFFFGFIHPRVGIVDPRVLLAKILTTLVTWKEVDIASDDPEAYERKEGVMLLTPLLVWPLIPAVFILSFVRSLLTPLLGWSLIPAVFILSLARSFARFLFRRFVNSATFNRISATFDRVIVTYNRIRYFRTNRVIKNLSFADVEKHLGNFIERACTCCSGCAHIHLRYIDGALMRERVCTAFDSYKLKGENLEYIFGIQSRHVSYDLSVIGNRVTIRVSDSRLAGAVEGDVAKPPKGSCADCLNSIISNDSLLDKALNEGFDIEADLKPSRLKLKNPNQPFSDTTIYDREIRPLIDLGILIHLPDGKVKFSDMMMRPNNTGPPDKAYTTNLVREINEIEYPIGQKGEAKNKPMHRGEIPPDIRPAIKDLVMTIAQQHRASLATPAAEVAEAGANNATLGSAQSIMKNFDVNKNRHVLVIQHSPPFIDGSMNLATGGSLSFASAKAEINKIHKENLKYTPILAANTVLCHIAAPSTLPDGQQGILNRLDSGMRAREYSEKMLELKTDSSTDFIEQVKDTMRRAQETYKEVYGKDYTNCTFKFDVACPSLDLVARVQKELNLPALAFAPQEGEGNMVQVENIMLALRALERSIETSNIQSLIDAYSFVTGKEIISSIKDIAEFAKTMLFAMPKINVNELGRINALIEENIKTAA